MNSRLAFTIRTALLSLTLFAAPAAAQEEEPGSSLPSMPIAQYAVAAIFGGLAIASVLRSSRRHWN